MASSTPGDGDGDLKGKGEEDGEGDGSRSLPDAATVSGSSQASVVSSENSPCLLQCTEYSNSSRSTLHAQEVVGSAG